jgi:DNA-binding transcriptional LysR family regulator
MKINHQYLKTFVCFCESRNTYETARFLGLTQPAVSKHLKIVEDMMGTVLFQIEGRKKVLNGAGLELYQQLKGKFEQIEESFDSIRNRHGNLINLRISIAGRQEVLNQISKYVIFPGRVDYYDINGTEVIEKLKSNKITFGISRFLQESPELIFKKLGTTKIGLFSHKNNSRNIKDYSRQDYINEIPCFSYSDQLQHLKEWCTHHKIKTDQLLIKGTINDWSSVLTMVQEKEGFTFCPLKHSEEFPELFVGEVNIKTIAPLELYLLYSQTTRDIFPLKKCFSLSENSKYLNQR